MHKQELNLNRQNWVALLWKICEPVLVHASSQTLKKSMPIHGPAASEREKFSHLEAVGRALAGLAPWLELEGLMGEEALLQSKARELAQSTVLAISDPTSSNYLNFGQGSQSVVDAAYLAQAILRAPNILWLSFSQKERRQIYEALLLTKKIKPYFNNWLLFSALIEALFYKIGASFDSMRIDYAIRQTHQWYVGDGLYADGPEYHCDYYNSYVIHPFLLDILEATKHTRYWPDFEKTFLIRAQRYSELLERMISPEGTMPITGRSISYRCGNLHALAQLALKQKLPLTLSPAKARCAMRAVISRTLQAPNTFDASGWLNIGLCGNQPSLAEKYVSTGSMYIASLAFLPLGLLPEAPFWSDPDTLFTSQLVYSGLDTTPDMALKEKV